MTTTDDMTKTRFNRCVCCTDLIRNFHVFPCSAMSRLEIIKQIPSRLWITEEDEKWLQWVEDCFDDIEEQWVGFITKSAVVEKGVMHTQTPTCYNIRDLLLWGAAVEWHLVQQLQETLLEGVGLFEESLQ